MSLVLSHALWIHTVAKKIVYVTEYVDENENVSVHSEAVHVLVHEKMMILDHEKLDVYCA